MPEWNAVKRYLPVAATILIVVGVAVIVRLAPGKPPAGTLNDGVPDSRTAASPLWLTIVKSNDVLRLTSGVGVTRECKLPEGYATVDRVSGDGFTVRSATGARMLVGLDCMVKNPKLVAGLANPSGARAAIVAAKRRDGAGVVEISDGKYTDEITLRGKNSRPYRDPEIIGWLDDNVIAVTAFQGDARYALTVQTTGRITELVKLPENAVEFRAGNGAFWYVMVTPGEGIELGPRGPSELHRVAAGGNDSVVAKEAGAVIENVLLGSGGSAAYRAGGTLMFRRADGKLLNIGTGQPLGWSQDGALLVSRNSRLFAVAPDGASADLEVASDGALAAWQFHPE